MPRQQTRFCDIIIIITFHYSDYFDYFFQVTVDLGIPDHEWNERRKKIANTFNSLGPNNHTPLRIGWLANIKEMYSSDDVTLPGALKCNLDTIFIDDNACYRDGLYYLQLSYNQVK